jgi:hypothetical protein
MYAKLMYLYVLLITLHNKKLLIFSFTRFLNGFVVLRRNLCWFWSNEYSERHHRMSPVIIICDILHFLLWVTSQKCIHIFSRYDQNSFHISRLRIPIDFSRKSAYCSWMTRLICGELCSIVEWCLVFEFVISQQTHSALNAVWYKT